MKQLLPALLLVILSRPLSADWAPLAERLDALRRNGQVPAMGLVILEEGKPALIRAFGDAHTSTPFRWGSITKSVTGLAALQLTREHDINLDSPIRPLLGPGYYVNDFSERHPVRLVDLLGLAAGFPDLSGSEFNDNVPYPLWTALERNAAYRVTLWPPGLQHSYSNIPPGLTAAVVEKQTGKTFERYVAERVFLPLGMGNASLEPLADLPGGFRADGETVIPYWHMTFRGFGALNASLAEMAGFASTLLNDGQRGEAQALAPEIVAQFFTPAPTLGVRAGLEVGYAAGVYGWVRDGHLFWGHGGDADGYLSRYGLLPEHGRGYLLVINADNPRLFGRLRRLVEQTLLEDLPAHAPMEPREDELQRYAGSYYPTSARFGRERWQRGEAERAEVQIDGERLVFQRDGRRTRLIPVGNGRFIRPEDPAVTVVFVRDALGTLHLQGELGNFANLSQGPCPGFIASCE